MKHCGWLLASLILLFLTACGTESALSPNEASASPASSDQPEIILDQTLTETYTPILAICLPQNGKTVIRYTYATNGTGPVALLLTSESGAEACFSLPAASEETYGTLWYEEPLSLQAGRTVVSAMGRGVQLSMAVQTGKSDATWELLSSPSET